MNLTEWSTIAVLALCAIDARAGDPVPGNHEAADRDASAAQPAGMGDPVPVRTQGVRAAIDPVSGSLIEPAPRTATSRGPEEEVATALTRQDFTKADIEYLPDGRVHVQLNGQLKMAAFARLDAGGHATTWCAPSSSLAPQLPSTSVHTHDTESNR